MAILRVQTSNDGSVHITRGEDVMILGYRQPFAVRIGGTDIWIPGEFLRFGDLRIQEGPTLFPVEFLPHEAPGREEPRPEMMTVLVYDLWTSLHDNDNLEEARKRHG